MPVKAYGIHTALADEEARVVVQLSAEGLDKNAGQQIDRSESMSVLYTDA